MRAFPPFNVQNATGGGGGRNGRNRAGGSLPYDQNFKTVTNFTVGLLVGASGRPVNGPGFLVPDGSEVRVRANNGLVAGNTAVVSVGLTPLGPWTPLNPLENIVFPVRNVANIWLTGTVANDGIVIGIAPAS